MRTTRIILASLALLLLCLVLGSVKVEARRYSNDEDDLAVDRAPHHKHRHRHELQPRYPPKKRPSNDEDDYYDDADYEDYVDEEEPNEDEYKDRRASRSGPPKRTNHRRYPSASRYHHRASSSSSSHHVGSARGHEARSHDRIGGSADRHRSRGSLAHNRKRWKDEDEYADEEVDYERARRRYDDEVDDDEDEYYGKQQHKTPLRRTRTQDSLRRSRYEPRKDWRYKLDDEEEEDDYAYDADDEESEELENERANRSRKHSARGHFRQNYREDEAPKSMNRRSAHNKLDEWMKRVRKEPEDNGEDEEEEDEELWKDAEELDNDFYKNDDSTSLKSYDDIIRRLTEDRTTTSATPVKRDYRNTFHDSRRNRSSLRHANLLDAGRKKSLQDELEEEVAQADANVDDSVSSASTPSTTKAPTTTSSTTSTTTTTTTTSRPWWNSPSKSTRSFNSESSQSKSESPMSPISVAKWDNLGTREGVEKTRNSMLGESTRVSEFNAVQRHAKRVAMEGSCRWPRAKVIPVLDIYYNSTATYYPHCVILHRCSDDTGCCSSETLTCEAKHSQRVELDFHVTYLHGNQGIVKLSFDNHTECLCNLRNNFDGHRNPRHNVHQAPANIVKQQQPRKPCRCPSNFLPTITSDDTCECTCPEKEETCQKLLIGKGYLSWVDRVCIQGGNCTSPKCVYGAYIVENGSCPQKRKAVEENFYSKSKYTRRPQLSRHNHPYLRGRSWNSP